MKMREWSFFKVIAIVALSSSSVSSAFAAGGDSIRSSAPMTALILDARAGNQGPLLEAYREDRLEGPQAAEILGFSRLEWNHFLKDRRVLEHAYTIEDLDRDVATIQRLRANGVLPPAI